MSIVGKIQEQIGPFFGNRDNTLKRPICLIEFQQSQYTHTHTHTYAERLLPSCVYPFINGIDTAQYNGSHFCPWFAWRNDQHAGSDVNKSDSIPSEERSVWRLSRSQTSVTCLIFLPHTYPSQTTSPPVFVYLPSLSPHLNSVNHPPTHRFSFEAFCLSVRVCCFLFFSSLCCASAPKLRDTHTTSSSCIQVSYHTTLNCESIESWGDCSNSRF